MRTWKEVIAEATAAEINKAGAAALRDERNKAKAEKQAKGKSSYQDYLERQLAFKKEKYEAQKRAQIERLKKAKVEKHTEKAKASLAGIKTQSISDKDKDPTAYAKAIGNVGSAAAGVAGAVVHGVRALAAKRAANKKAKEAEASQPEKRERQAAGRPPAPPKPAVPSSGVRKPAPYSQQYGTAKPKTTKQITGTPERPKLSSAGGKSLPPAGPRRLPPSGGTTPTQSLGQQARQNPQMKKRMIAQRNQAEEYSNWREEFLYEIDKKFDKGQKKDVVDVMKGKNKIEINPNEISVKEAVDQTSATQNQQKQQNTQQIQQQQIQTRNQMTIQQKQQALQQKLQQIAKQKLSLEKQGKLAIPSSYAEAYKDEEGGMARNEISTIERAVKSLRGKIKSDKQQLPAWVQSKITKAADHIDTVADYMMGETEPVKESYNEGDETFRQHSRETFATHKPSATRERTSRVLQKMKELNKDAKKKNKTKLKEEGPVLSVGRGEKLPVSKGAGLTKKGREKYNRETGSHLQAPVTGDVKPGSKAAQRRKNFCSRSRSWHGERGLAARRRWKC